LENKPVVMAGFRDYTLEKYLQKLSDAGYTAVVYIQEKDGKNVKRVLQSVYSAGTYLSYDTDSNQQITNHIMCIWIEKYTLLRNAKKETMVCGIAVANIFTGKSSIFEYQNAFYMNPTTFDELERCISTYSPSEIIVNSTTLESTAIDTIMQYIGIRNAIVHKNTRTNPGDANISRSESVGERNPRNSFELRSPEVSRSPTASRPEIFAEVKKSTKSLLIENDENPVIRCTQQTYIRHILTQFFGEESATLCSEFQTYSIATQAFCFLLHFIQEHNPNLIRNIEIPLFRNNSENLVLANHTLKQLNIIDDASLDGKQSGKFSSVLAFLNKCCSPMGRRLFQQQLIYPTSNSEWLNKEYAMTELFLSPQNSSLISPFRKCLGELRDIEKMCRQITIKKIYPASIFHLYKTVEKVQQLHICLGESKEIQEYLTMGVNENNTSRFATGDDQTSRERCPKAFDKSDRSIDDISKDILQTIDHYLFIEKCKDIQSIQTFEEPIIKKGISIQLDTVISQYEENLHSFHKIREWLNSLMKSKNAGPEDDTEYIKIHSTEKSGVTLQITKKRGSQLKTILKSIENPPKDFDGLLKFSISDIKFSNASTSNEEIDIPCLGKICKSMLYLKEQINEHISKTYLVFLDTLEKECLAKIERLVNYIAKLDVLQCKAYIAQTYHYCKPTINSSHETAFISAKGLRHVLIEQLQQHELYVSNDIDIGSDSSPYGILLYGTNAVGKTSLIRALGISVIMAQSGLYVPCSQFIYKPYTSIFSRILGIDNLFKGLSTFAVEMSELRMILRNADKNSLILGDELCSGTETESALSIFMAGLMDLHAKQSSFIFATHFHEIIHFDEMKMLDRLVLKHMAVHYDREMDCLVYDRVLRDGPGNRMYGLEVCKSLYLPEEFLETAYRIRTKYYPTARGELANSSSPYNSKKIRGLCELCKHEMGEEIHHLQPQKDADDAGFIGDIHKNHPANLMSLCESCHLKMHHSNNSEPSISDINERSENAEKNAAKKTKVVRKKTTKGYVIAEV
jgi:DNA mismatch repair protein MutS